MLTLPNLITFNVVQSSLIRFLAQRPSLSISGIELSDKRGPIPVHL